MSQNMISSSEEETATKGFSEDEIIAQSILFILAGFNTTSDVLKTILWAFLRIKILSSALWK